jgi:hypothetical protein
MPNQPFKRLEARSIQIEYQFQARIAHALEFIAEQLGEINERLATDAAAKEQARAESSGWSQAPGGTRPPGR